MTDAGREAEIVALLQRPYRLVIRGEPVEGYLAEAPEFPGCITAGETEAEALANLKEAMALWLTWALDRGLPIPEPEGRAGTRQRTA